MIRNVLSIGAACTLLLLGCGGGGSSSESDSDNQTAIDSGTNDSGTNTDPDNSNASLLTGIFVDSAVQGVSYTTETRSGVTNSAGEFLYLEGETVTFSIGSLVFPSIPAAEQVSPVDMALSSSDPSATTTNIARLLQSLDQDGNPNNGITISADIAVGAPVLNFDVSTVEFENNAEVVNLVANSGSVTMALVAADQAVAHLNATLGNTSEESTKPTILGHSLSADSLTLTVNFSIDMTRDYKTEGAYIPSRTYWQDPKTFIVEFESVQAGGSITLIPEFFVSVSGETLATAYEIVFPNVPGAPETGSQTDVTLSSIADFYGPVVNDQGRQFYLLVSADGSVTEYGESTAGSGCFALSNWRFVSLGGDLFRLERPDGNEDLRIARQNGDLKISSDNNGNTIVYPQTSTSPSNLPVCN